jgi:predicted TIM-barrel fold metal-dependent hydrolase
MRPQARALLKVAPERLVWGSNWPHPHDADKKLDDVGLLDVLLDWVEDDAHRHALLVENPAILYGFER